VDGLLAYWQETVICFLICLFIASVIACQIVCFILLRCSSLVAGKILLVRNNIFRNQRRPFELVDVLRSGCELGVLVRSSQIG